jgi:hypothetical protein
VNGPSNPADPCSVVAFFGTGYGPLVRSCATGGLNPPGPVPLYWRGTSIGHSTTGYPLEYKGSAPMLLCGIVQFNFQVPLKGPSGQFLLTPYINPGYGSTISSGRFCRFTGHRRHDSAERRAPGTEGSTTLFPECCARAKDQLTVAPCSCSGFFSPH